MQTSPHLDTGGILGDVATLNTINGGSAVKSVFVFDISGGAITDADIEQMIGDIDLALGAITDAATSLGSVKQRVDNQSDLVSLCVTQSTGALVNWLMLT